MGQLRSPQIGGSERRKPEDHHGARIEIPKQEDRERHQHHHRQGAKGQEQDAALFGPHQANNAEEIRHQRRVGEAGQGVQQDGDQREPDIAREQHIDMRPGLVNQRLVDQKGDEQRAAGEQQRHHRARLQPVQTIALIEAGIDHRDGGAEQQHAAPVGVPQQVAVDRFVGRAEIDHQAHQRRDHHALPIQPLPSQMVDIEADQRGRGVEREPDPDRIDRDRRQPPFDRQIAQDDHQRRRHEGAEQHAMHDAERDQRG